MKSRLYSTRMPGDGMPQFPQAGEWIEEKLFPILKDTI